jgi:cellobiose phosphorylase
MFRGPENPWAGLSLRSWYTGTTGWVFRCITQFMLGVKPTYEGLLIDPVLPKSWDSVKMHRIFRGSTYDITINTSSEAEDISIELDGKQLDGNLIPIDENIGHHSVVVVCGKSVA